MSENVLSTEEKQRIDEAEALRQRALAGDEFAATEFVLALLPRVNSVARKCGLSPHDQEDVSQDVLMRVYSHMLDTDEEGKTAYQASNPFAWVATVTRNRIYDMSRRKARKEIISTSFEAWEPKPFPGNQTHQQSPEQEAVRNESLARVKALLSKTDATESMILVLIDREVHGLTYEEIAKKRELNLGTVRSQIHRAKAYARQVLEERGFTDFESAADIFDTLKTT